MAKVRNSLGVLVLPTTGGSSLSFEKYEKENGINLHSLLVLDSDNHYLVLNPDISKAIFLDQSKAAEYYDSVVGLQVIKIGIVTVIGSDTNGDQEYENYDLMLATENFRVYFRHTVYSDGTTPDEFTVFTQEL